jgi:hypothetical protein
MMDYQTHSNGFERANNWESEIGKSMVHWADVDGVARGWKVLFER